MNFEEHLSKYLSKKEIDELMSSLEKDSFNCLLLDESKISSSDLLNLYPNLRQHPIIKNAFYFNKNEYQLGKSILHELGAFYIQEPSAMLVSYLLNPNKDDVVLDMCAAPGGKTIQASLLMNNEGLLISNDISFTRLKALHENVERMGRGNVVITNNDFSKIYSHYLNSFDKIILDAPCSGSGMFRKEDKMKDDWSYNKVLKNAEVQKELIDLSYKMLKPGGVLAYSTCSFSYEEDEEVIKSLLDSTDAELFPITNSQYFYKSKEDIGIHLLPSKFDGEGHYICLIKKPGNNTSKTPIYREKEIKNNVASLVNKGFIFKYLNVLKNGVTIEELFKDDIKYDYHYVRFAKDFDQELELSYQELEKYIKGESLKSNIKGHVLLKYHSLNVDIGKGDGQLIKNKLPKFIKTKNLY